MGVIKINKQSSPSIIQYIYFFSVNGKTSRVHIHKQAISTTCCIRLIKPTSGSRKQNNNSAKRFIILILIWKLKIMGLPSFVDYCWFINCCSLLLTPLSFSPLFLLGYMLFHFNLFRFFRSRVTVFPEKRYCMLIIFPILFQKVQESFEMTLTNYYLFDRIFLNLFRGLKLPADWLELIITAHTERVRRGLSNDNGKVKKNDQLASTE